MSVTRFLVSGTDEQLMEFHCAVCMLLNDIERRGQTIHYTCMGEDRDIALKAGTMAGVTMQEGSDPPETWTIVVQGDHPGWSPKKRKKSR